MKTYSVLVRSGVRSAPESASAVGRSNVKTGSGPRSSSSSTCTSSVELEGSFWSRLRRKIESLLARGSESAYAGTDCCSASSGWGSAAARAGSLSTSGLRARPGDLDGDEDGEGEDKQALRAWESEEEGVSGAEVVEVAVECFLPRKNRRKAAGGIMWRGLASKFHGSHAQLHTTCRRPSYVSQQCR